MLDSFVSQLARPFITRVVTPLLVVLCQLLHESHHYLELLIHQETMVISPFSAGFGCATHLAIHKTRKLVCKLLVIVTN